MQHSTFTSYFFPKIVLYMQLLLLATPLFTTDYTVRQKVNDWNSIYLSHVLSVAVKQILITGMALYFCNVF